MKHVQDGVGPRIVVTGKAGRILATRPKPSKRDAGDARGGIVKVSHTLRRSLAERLRSFAFFQDVSESAVIETALEALFSTRADDRELGALLRARGAARRRRN